MINLSKSIKLQTEFGNILVRHFSFRDGEGPSIEGDSQTKEGVVLARSQHPPQPTVVRLQSSCLFGEAFWATECDCGKQLHFGLEEILRRDGILIYLYEEGRGAGLKRKVEAIRLQQELGIETDQAFECLALESDLRTYRAASKALVSVLQSEPEIILLTNNPAKRAGLEKNGIRVVATEPHIAPNMTDGMKRYLAKKRERLGHEIPPNIGD